MVVKDCAWCSISPLKTLERISVHIFWRPSLEDDPIFLCLWSNNPRSTWAIFEVLYKRVGEDRVKQFGLDSAVNKLPYDRHEEELSVQKFAKLLRPATQGYLANPTTQQLPSWSRVLSCENKLQEDLANAGSKEINSTKKELINNF